MEARAVLVFDYLIGPPHWTRPFWVGSWGATNAGQSMLLLREGVIPCSAMSLFRHLAPEMFSWHWRVWAPLEAVAWEPAAGETGKKWATKLVKPPL